MKYKIGDKVKIREDLEYGHVYDVSLYMVTTEMLKYRGKVATIVDADDCHYSYEIDLDEGHYSWSNKMFEDVEESEAKFKIGDKVRILTGSNSDKVATVKDVGEENGEKFYLLDIDWYIRGYYGHNLELAEREDDTEIMNTDTKYERTVDVEFKDPKFGKPRVIKDVFQVMFIHGGGSIVFATKDRMNEYILPIDMIEWVIPRRGLRGEMVVYDNSVDKKEVDEILAPLLRDNAILIYDAFDEEEWKQIDKERKEKMKKEG